MNLRRPIISATLIVGFVILAVPAGSQAQIKAGVHGTWGSRMNFGVGARAYVEPYKTRDNVELLLAYDHFFPDDDLGIDIGYWELTLGVTYRLSARSRNPATYVGAGLTVGSLEARTDALGAKLTGKESQGYLDALAGVVVPLGKAKPFAEGRFSLGKSVQFVLSTGVLF